MAGVSSSRAAQKHLMAHKPPVQTVSPIGSALPLQETHTSSSASVCGNVSCRAGMPELFYFITFIFLFLYAPFSEDSYLSQALLREGKKPNKAQSAGLGGDDLSLFAALHFCSPESRQFKKTIQLRH